MEFVQGCLFRMLYIPLILLVGERECGVEVKPDGAPVPHRMHHQLNMRGPHHPRASEATHMHHRPHYQLQRPSSEDGLHSTPKITQDTNLLRDAEHIREDLESMVPSKDTKKMSPEELEFYYFKLHDFDNNTKLDGLEILQAIQHVMHVEDEHDQTAEAELSQTVSEGADAKSTITLEETERLEDDFSYFVELIDKVLEEDDLDNDGFLSYAEYVQGRKKDQIKKEEMKRKS